MSGPKIRKSIGVTSSERYLKSLCERSFLSLWSYPGVYRDQGRLGSGGDGKEVCDLLVAFENHIIIFSDKDISFLNCGNLETSWRRWYKRAVLRSADQIWGAERWIIQHPDRLFLNPSCTQRFPLALPGKSDVVFHRIVVAHGISQVCRDLLGGSGSLMVTNVKQSGEGAHSSRISVGAPFVVGELDTQKGFVHVLDDTSLDILMGTLDTITDFVTYLAKKEAFLRSNTRVSAAGEEELLAYYLTNYNEIEERDFVVPTEVGMVSIVEGNWDNLNNSPEWKSRSAANRISYAWDALIENSNKHAMEGTLYFSSHPEIQSHERVYRFLARESRFRRRILADALFGIMGKTKAGQRGTRVMLPSNSGEPHYVFLVLAKSPSANEDDYRLARRSLLYSCCLVAKLKCPNALDIVGLATEPIDSSDRSEDTMYLDARDWSTAMQKEAEEYQAKLHLLTNLDRFEETAHEYPISSKSNLLAGISLGIVPARNKACPCGSGKKYKRCHGG